MADDFDWGSLESDVVDGEFRPATVAPRGPDAKTEKFPCQACRGSGKYRGVRRHQAKAECFACGGKGYFLTSERDRQKARGAYRATKARKLTSARETFDAQFPGVGEYLTEAAKWSPFAAELLGKLGQYGYLTEKQAAAVLSMRAKAEAKRVERQAEQRSQVVDLSPIRAMFETAVKSGYKRPIYRAAGLVITRAPDHGKNPGALYVCTESDDYLGKILGTTYQGKPAEGLTAIAADPRGEAVRYGQRTGTCACCGRTLTAGVSIELGIGPICAEKWGL